MSTKELMSEPAQTVSAVSDMKLEVAIIPVSNVDRSKDFYASLGWRLDADFHFENGFRSFSSRRPDQGVPSSSARSSRPRNPAQSGTSTASCRTLRPRAANWYRAACP
jgi:catechol 2,3-dioxygenase-like lactoylglutathione lyase family enzyme